MAASLGGQAPPPPKRPTIIKPSTENDESGHRVPARPAPPVPGGRPTPALPSRPEKVPMRPQPPGPNIATDMSRPKSMPPQPVRPTDKTTTAKKRPEITIVCARPMTEVGFRENKPEKTVNTATSATESSKQTSISDSSSKSPRPSPSPAPRTAARVEQKDNILDLIDFSGPVEGTSHCAGDISILKPGILHKTDDSRGSEDTQLDTGDTKEEKKSLPSRTPPPVPQPLLKSGDSPTAAPPIQPPLVPRQPPLIPGRPALLPVQQKAVSSYHETEQEMHNETSSLNLKPKPHGAPPPIPRIPSVRSLNPPPVVSKEKEILADTGYKNAEIECQVTSENIQNIDGLYAVVNKPKRPTIIRPGKPDAKHEQGSNAEVQSVETKVSPTPRKSKAFDDSSTHTVSHNVDLPEIGVSHQSNDQESAVPEFLRKKLKSTVSNVSESPQDSMDSAAGRAATDPGRHRPPSIKGPPPATKPKPTILQKPSVAAKPSLNASSKANNISNIKADDDGSIASGDADSKHTLQTEQENISNDLENVVKTPEIKRPTIIRPARPGKFGSVENVSAGDKNDNAEVPSLKQVSDDSVINSKHGAQPPLPNKRPVSMTNIHKAVDEDAKLMANLTNNLTQSSENVSSSSRPKPVPRAAPRGRPASMMVPPVSRPQPPGTGPKLDVSHHEHSGLPPRPNSRPSPVKQSSQIQEQGLKDVSSEHENPVLFGVSVLPRPEKGPSGPVKPERMPLPPKVSPRKSAESSDEEEFVIAKEKPDRPSAGPPRRPSAPASKETSGVEMQKPPMPGPPPSPNKVTLIESLDKDGDDEPTLQRSKSDSKPSRPMSMPVKTSPPSKPHPPRPQGPVKLPALPARPKPGHPLYHHMMQVPHGIAVFDYTGQHDDELSFKTGDLVILLKRIDADWLYGKIDEHEGMFPKDFVKIKMPLPGEKLEGDNSSSDSTEMFYDASSEKPDYLGHGPRCRARFDFDGEGLDDLVFEEGDIIRLVQRVGLEWRKGEINGKVGFFPLSFVEVIEDLPDEKDDVSSNVVKAVFDFHGEEGELSFQAGDSITVTHLVNEEWLFGEMGNRKGQFPVQFVDHVPCGLTPLVTNKEVKEDEQKKEELHKPGDEAHPAIESSSGLDAKHTSSEETSYCVALYDYPAQTDEDLTFSVGDRIELIERVSQDWLKGKLGTNIGIFPSAFVEVKIDVKDINIPPVAHSPTLSETKENSVKFGVALYDFNGENDNELTFREGDRLEVQGVVEGAEDWCWGVIHGHRGMFPEAFVRLES